MIGVLNISPYGFAIRPSHSSELLHLGAEPRAPELRIM